MDRVQSFTNLVIRNIEKVIVGKRDILELLMVAMFCEGHVLLEDVPGTGKTMMARSLAISLGGTFKRLQCTPDLLPNDVSGVSVFNQSNSEFEFRPGPVFVNILLADEINRATPRTQSALLEAMQEKQVTVDGVTRSLPRPFMVVATQNPIEYEGTFPLPEAQLDRFLLRLPVGYPGHDDEKMILNNLSREHPINNLRRIEHHLLNDRSQASVLSELLVLEEEVWDVYLDESLQDYIINLINATRNHQELLLGGSPRASLALYKTSQALAALRGRDHVIPDDIKYLSPYVLSHRLIARPEAELRGRTISNILDDILSDTLLEIGDLAK